jgi:hypothetical protein
MYVGSKICHRHITYKNSYKKIASPPGLPYMISELVHRIQKGKGKIDKYFQRFTFFVGQQYSLEEYCYLLGYNGV